MPARNLGKARVALANQLRDLDAPILNPGGDLGYLGFNTFSGDNRTFAVILLAPPRTTSCACCARIGVGGGGSAATTPLDVMSSA